MASEVESENELQFEEEDKERASKFRQDIERLGQMHQSLLESSPVDFGNLVRVIVLRWKLKNRLAEVEALADEMAAFTEDLAGLGQEILDAYKSHAFSK